MTNLLPIYYKDKAIDCLKTGNFNNYEYGLMCVLSNSIPTFVSEQIKIIGTSYPTVTDFKVRFLSKDNLSKGTITVLSEFDQDNSILTVVGEYKNGQYFYSVANKFEYPLSNITTGKGIYQLKIEMSNGDYYFSDIFVIDGVPLATYECRNAYFDSGTNIFSIDVQRTDSNSDANSLSYLIMNYYNSMDDEIVGYEIKTVDINIGILLPLTFDVSGITKPFDFFKWSGCCTDELELEVYIYENGSVMTSEGNYFILTENN